MNVSKVSTVEFQCPFAPSSVPGVGVKILFKNKASLQASYFYKIIIIIIIQESKGE